MPFSAMVPVYLLTTQQHELMMIEDTRGDMIEIMNTEEMESTKS